MKVSVRVVGTHGSSSTNEVEVAEDATVGQVLETAGIDPKNKELTATGPVSLNDKVSAGLQLVVTERVRGS